MLSDQYSQTKYLKRLFNRAGYKPNVVQYTSQVFTILQSVRENAAGGFLSEEIVAFEPHLISFPLYEVDLASITVIWRRDRASFSAAETFSSYLKNKKEPSDQKTGKSGTGNEFAPASTMHTHRRCSFIFIPRMHTMPNDKIKKEEAKLAKRQEQLKRARDAERIQKRKLANLKRNERTHRLCIRGGMLESIMKRPDCIDPAEIEDEQLRSFLASLLSLPGVESKLTELLPPDTSRDDHEPDGGNDLTG